MSGRTACEGGGEVSDDRTLRTRAAFDLGRRAPYKLQEHGHRSGQQILLALESDRIADVLERLRPYEPPVMIAIYHPDKEAFAFLIMQPRHVPGVDDRSNLDVDPNSSIGMLIDCLQQEELHKGTIRITVWDEPILVEGEEPAFV